MKGRRYWSLGDYYRLYFGGRLAKVPIDAGMSCPNREHRTSGGCTYCSGTGSAASLSAALAGDVAAQVRASIPRLERRFRPRGFMAYFQAYSNTHAPVDQLRQIYDQALQIDPRFVGLSIGTRPDCIDDERLDLIASYAQRGYEVWIEYGVQSLHDSSLERINRGHDARTALDAIRTTRARGIQVCAHLIYGLPGESEAQMLASLRKLADTGMDGIKIHMLHLLRGTRMAQEYEQRPFGLLERSQYVDLVAQSICELPPNVVVQRLTGDAPAGADLVGPEWIRDKNGVLQDIENRLQAIGGWQGSARADISD